jgi:integrase
MIGSKRPPHGAPALTPDHLRELLDKLRESENCWRRDLVDPITLLIATGLRRSELLCLRWADYDAAAGTITVCGKVIRERGKGLVRIDETKTAAGHRTIPLPAFAIKVLEARRKRPFIGAPDLRSRQDSNLLLSG